jgi:LemA protein
MKSVAAFRGGRLPESERNAVSQQIDASFARLFPQVEAYPDLKAHAAIADAMQQNSYLQKEITAARSLYNDTVNQWNNDIFAWPTKMIVAARAGYTTRIPFTASAETKAKARETFF